MKIILLSRLFAKNIVLPQASMQTLKYNISNSRNNFRKPYGESCLEIKNEILIIEPQVFEAELMSNRDEQGRIGLTSENLIVPIIT